jgi:predicted transcriptional regulator
MDKSHNLPLCENCRNLSNKSAVPELIDILNRVLGFSNKLKTAIKFGLCAFFFIILGLTILFQIKGFSFLLGINYTFLRYIPTLLALIIAVSGFVLLRHRSTKHKMKKELITAAQIETLLKADNKLTPSRLATATNTSVEYAKKILNDLAVEGKLTVSVGAYELIYSKDLLFEREAHIGNK